MKYLFALLLIIFPFGQLARFDLGSGIVLHLNDLAVAFVLLFGLREISGPMVKPLVFFLLAIMLSLAFNTSHLFIAALYPLRFFAYAGLYFVFKDQKLPTRWLTLSIVAIAVFGLLQYIFVPNVSFLSAQNWDDHYYRLVGPYLDPGFTGAILMLGLLLAPKTLTPLIYIAMALTYSRATYLMYLVSYAFIAFSKKSLKIFVVAATVLTITIFILPKSSGEGTKLARENSIYARLNNWKESISIWQTSPIYGVGFNTYRYVRGIGDESHAGAGADSSILLVLATTGLVGLISYLYLLYAMWNLGKHNLIFAASFLGILAHSFFNNTLFYPWVMEFIWLLLALFPSDSQPGRSRRP